MLLCFIVWSIARKQCDTYECFVLLSICIVIDICMIALEWNKAQAIEVERCKQKKNKDRKITYRWIKRDKGRVFREQQISQKYAAAFRNFLIFGNYCGWYLTVTRYLVGLTIIIEWHEAVLQAMRRRNKPNGLAFFYNDKRNKGNDDDDNTDKSSINKKEISIFNHTQSALTSIDVKCYSDN